MESEAGVRDLNASGCVQEETKMEQTEYEQVEFLDLSDDVLLYIFKFCSHNDLKALAYTHPRLARLALEWRLWTKVDARDVNYDKHRLLWLIRYALSERTTSLAITGFAKQAAGCAEYAEHDIQKQNTKQSQTGDNEAGPSTAVNWDSDEVQQNTEHVGPSYILRDMHQSSSSATPFFEPSSSTNKSDTSECPEPIVTITRSLMEYITSQCNLTSLNLEYCNINLLCTGLDIFPLKLKRLSLKGTRCYNQPRPHKNLLFKLPDHLPCLEYINLSECAWLGPSSLLALSKLTQLKELYLKRCPKMTDFLAYAALATRFGFAALEVVDFRGSPVGDSEVSSFSAVPPLRVLRCAAAGRHNYTHAHTPVREQWEMQEPEFLKRMQLIPETDFDMSMDDDNINLKQVRPPDSEQCNYSVLLTAEDVLRSRQIFAGELLHNMVHMMPNLNNGGEGMEAGNWNIPHNYPRPNSSRLQAMMREAGIGIPGNRNVNEGNDNGNARAEDGNAEAGNMNMGYRVGRFGIGNIEDVNINVQGGNINGDRVRIRTSEDIASKRRDVERGNNQCEAPPTKKQRLDETAFGEGSGVSGCSRDKPENSRAKCSRDNTESSRDIENSHSDSAARDEEESSQIMEVCRNKDESSEDSLNIEGEVDFQNKDESLCEMEQCQDKAESSRSLGESSYGAGSSSEDKGESSQDKESSSNEREKESSSEDKSTSDRESVSIDKSEDKSTSDRESVSIDKSESNQDIESNAMSYQNTAGGSHDNDQSSRANSRDNPESSRSTGESSRAQNTRDENPDDRSYYRFRRNDRPMLLRNHENLPVYFRHYVVNDTEERDNEERARERQARTGRSFNHTIHRHLSNILNGNQNRLIRHPVIYVDYGDAAIPRTYATPSPNNSLLVTDSAILMYGTSNSENVNVIHLSLNHRPPHRQRPERSSLEELVVNGYSMITDRSLVHLATAAPRLRLLDLRRTRVTAAGVNNFKCLRPDCVVLHSDFDEKEEDN